MEKVKNIENEKTNVNIKHEKNTLIEQETKVYNFKEDIKKQKIEDAVNNKNKDNNKIVEKNIPENINKNTQNKKNIEIIKEAEKILNSANLKNEKQIKSDKKRKYLFIFLLLIIVILFFIIISTIFDFLNRNNNRIIHGVYINNINISNYTKEEALEIIENKLNNNEKNYITVNYNNFSKNIYLEDINGKFDVQNAVNTAYNIGRKNNIIYNNYEILFTLIAKNNVDVTFSYDKDLLEKQIDLISLEIPGIATDSTYIIDGNNLVIKNSKAGVQINKNNFTQNLINSFMSEQKSFEILIEQCEKRQIDIEKIYNEVYKEAKNASYTTKPYNIYKEETGLDFAISLDEAKKILEEDKEEYIIPLKVLYPQITVSTLDEGAYPNLLSTFTTRYGTADVNRNTNISLAAKSITNIVLMPGEEFSYNNLIGECSTKTGYKAATIYLNGELATGVGGGICQVSTTLYNTVLRANLEIVERRNHSLSVTYVPLGQDAMVSIGTQDFKFKNNRNYPIKVVATTAPGSITCQIYGLAQDIEYDVKLYSRVISKTETKTKVETYKLLYLDGKEVSRTWLSTDTYKNH